LLHPGKLVASAASRNHCRCQTGIAARWFGSAPNNNPSAPFLSDEPEWVLDIVERVRPYTMTPPERVVSLCHAIQYVTLKQLPGDLVEGGVWRGGSMMAAAIALLHLKDTTRSIYLFDTYEGMPSPTQKDKRIALTSSPQT
jgi:O-methyltransferase